MESYQIFADNIKCDGCVKSIQSNLGQLPGVKEVLVSKDNGLVTVSGNSLEKKDIVNELVRIGYPEKIAGKIVGKSKSIFGNVFGKRTK